MTDRKQGESRRGNAGKGRKPGSKNKLSKALKDMILGALETAGGEAYLVKQAEANPGPFLSLIGKVLPSELQLNAEVTVHALTDEQRAERAAYLLDQARARRIGSDTSGYQNTLDDHSRNHKTGSQH